ncbi:hypothetical protein Q9885_004572 [Vibrio parahaemolyticus]|nr:hypothetical protein [Vibrio parahaemolyticus]
MKWIGVLAVVILFVKFLVPKAVEDMQADAIDQRTTVSHTVDTFESSSCEELNPEAGIDDSQFADLILNMQKVCAGEAVTNPMKTALDAYIGQKLSPVQETILNGLKAIAQDLINEPTCLDYGAVVKFSCPSYLSEVANPFENKEE